MLEIDAAASLESFLVSARSSGHDVVFRKDAFVFAGLFSINCLEEHLSNPLLTPDWLRITLKGAPVDMTQHYLWKLVQKRQLRFLARDPLQDALSAGGAVVLEGIDILDSRISRVCSRLEGVLPCSLVNCEAFFSRRSSEAYSLHCDSDDVLVAQISGVKQWRVHKRQNRRYVNNSPLDPAETGPPSDVLSLAPGDLLFVAAGVPHQCVTVQDHSLHLSFDLCDRSPSIEQITAIANGQHNSQLPPMFSRPDEVLEHYRTTIDSPQFRESLRVLLSKTRSDARAFRSRTCSSKIKFAFSQGPDSA